MRAPTRRVVFHPATVLAASLLGAGLYALYASLRFPRGSLPNQYLYVVPVVAPFVAFLSDCAGRLGELTPWRGVVDALVVMTAMWRVIGHVPYVSGHALFLTYALLSSRSRVARITAGLVMLEVVYLKYFVWHDWITPTVGIVLGSLAALVRRLAPLNGRRL